MTLAQRIAALSPEKRDLLLRQLEATKHQQQPILSQQPRVYDRTYYTHFPLSFAQQRLWFLDQLEPGSAAYLVLHALHFQGDLNVAVMERSLEQLVHRHESLRTTFEVQEGQPVQVIHPPERCVVPVIDLQALLSEHREQQVRALLQQEAERPCDLERGPLLRMALLRLEPQEHVLLLMLHHIITDDWSSQILVDELSTLYQAHVSGQPSPLSALPIQYADYALWQQEWLQGEVFTEQLAYWRKRLANASTLALPTDHPHPAVQTYRGALQSLLLPQRLLEALQTLSRQERVTMSMLLLAAWQVLLARYSGQSDISVGTPIANRRLAELEAVVGFFVNTLVMRTDLSADPSFVQVLQRVREVALGAYAHQDIPFEKVVEELEPERDLSHSPLFQVMFVLLHPAQGLGELAGLSIKPLALQSNTSKFDLTLSVEETEQGLHCSLEYNTDLFEAQTIRRLLGHWQTLLEGIVQSPQVRLSDLPLLAQREREQLLVQWNATQVDFAQDVCVHQLFEQQVERTPDAVALVFEDQLLSYAELNRRANQLAHYLQGLGVGPERLVGICMQRSLEMVVALLAVLKAGGAYVPLDPAYPAERLALMLMDSQVQVILTDQRQEGHQSPADGAQAISLDTHWKGITATKQENPLWTGAADTLVYLIYTSGSTGKPKGTMVTHGNVVNFFLAMDQALGDHVPGIWFALTSICFDISVLELLWTLTRGFQVVVQASPQDLSALGEAASGETIAAQIKRRGVTHLQCTPSLAKMIVSEPEWLTALGSLEYLLLGGEALPVSLAHQLDEVMVGTIHNMYGPTETTIWSTTHPVEKQAAAITIGRPIANTYIYILDTHLQVVPRGVCGELCIGGKGVVRGYWNHPDVTAEKFLPDPFSRDAGALMYRTGDVARYRVDGTIEYVGRMDQQIKLRGYRIELGEIEAVLSQHPAIQETVVLAREDVPTEKRLVAYLVMHQEQVLTISDVRSYLQDRLPAYMIPSAFVTLDTLPLMPNGKVDRRALPAPEETQQKKEGVQQRAKTPMEELLVGLWSKVLGRRQVGVDENFFELGGHSLLATRLITHVRAVLQVELPLRVVFEAPTVAELAQRVQEALGKEEGMRVPPLVARERPEEIPLSFAQQRLWFLDQLEPSSTAYLIPIAQRLQGNLNVAALEQGLWELIHRHESLRTTFVERDGQPVQMIHPPEPCVVPVIDLQGLLPEHREHQVKEVLQQEAEQPCDLERGPLLRMALLRLEPQEHVLLLTLHHIITDDWSNQIVMHELSTLYQTHVSGQPSPLSALPIQYADYALWQRAWLQGEVLTEQLAYWRKHLAGILPLALPTDHPRPAVQTYRGALQSLLLPQRLLEALQVLSRQEQVTLFMLLLAAWQVLLARYSGQT